MDLSDPIFWISTRNLGASCRRNVIVFPKSSIYFNRSSKIKNAVLLWRTKQDLNRLIVWLHSIGSHKISDFFCGIPTITVSLTRTTIFIDKMTSIYPQGSQAKTARSENEIAQWTAFLSSFPNNGGLYTGSCLYDGLCVYELMIPEFKQQNRDRLGIGSGRQEICNAARFKFVSKYVVVAPCVDNEKTRFSIMMDLKFTPHWISTPAKVHHLLFNRNVDPPIEYIYSGNQSDTGSLKDVNVWDSVEDNACTGSLSDEAQSRLTTLLNSALMQTLTDLVVRHGKKDPSRSNLYIDFGSSTNRNSSRKNSPHGFAVPNQRKLPPGVPETPFLEANELLSLLFRSRITPENLPDRFTPEVQAVIETYQIEGEFPSVRACYYPPGATLAPHCDSQNDGKKGLSPVAVAEALKSPTDKNSNNEKGRISIVGFPRECLRQVQQKRDLYGEAVDIAQKYYESLPESRRTAGPSFLCSESDLWAENRDTFRVQPAHMCKTIYYGSVSHIIESMVSFFERRAQDTSTPLLQRRIVAGLLYSAGLTENTIIFRAFCEFIRNNENQEFQMLLLRDPGMLPYEADRYYKNRRKHNNEFNLPPLAGSRIQPNNNGALLTLDECKSAIDCILSAGDKSFDDTRNEGDSKKLRKAHEKATSAVTACRKIGPLLSQHIVGFGAASGLYAPQLLKFGRIDFASGSAYKIRKRFPDLDDQKQWDEVHAFQLIMALSARLGISESDAENVFCECGREGWFSLPDSARPPRRKFQQEVVFAGQPLLFFSPEINGMMTLLWGATAPVFPRFMSFETLPGNDTRTRRLSHSECSRNDSPSESHFVSSLESTSSLSPELDNRKRNVSLSEPDLVSGNTEANKETKIPRLIPSVPPNVDVCTTLSKIRKLPCFKYTQHLPKVVVDIDKFVNRIIPEYQADDAIWSEAELRYLLPTFDTADAAGAATKPKHPKKKVYSSCLKVGSVYHPNVDDSRLRTLFNNTRSYKDEYGCSWYFENKHDAAMAMIWSILLADRHSFSDFTLKTFEEKLHSNTSQPQLSSKCRYLYLSRRNYRNKTRHDIPFAKIVLDGPGRVDLMVYNRFAYPSGDSVLLHYDDMDKTNTFNAV